MLCGSSSSSGGPSSSSSSSGPAVSVINIICSYYCFTMTVSWMMAMILVSSSLVVQRSESFLIIPTTTTTIRSSRHSPVIQHNHGHYYYFDNGICSSNRYSVRRGGAGLTALSSVKQQSTNEEEKQLTTKKKSRRTWKESYQLLVSYKENHGNCNVPFRYKEDPRLGNWVKAQRRRKDRLSDERIAKLDDLGFSWSNELRDQQWEEMFEKLQKYNKMYGNCNVPKRYKDDSRLGRWVERQRQRKDRLSDDRIAKLNDLGFSWANEINEEQWDKMFERLVQYTKENNGDCNVPGNNDNDDNKELYQWVGVQRKRKSLLSKERRTKLDKLGLIWEDSNRVKADQKWNEKYELLQEYKQKYGHCRVPSTWKEDPTLGVWVFTQRQFYRKGLLREDRQMKLEEIDFTWKVREGPAPDHVQLDLKWLIKFGILLNFLEEHGHCDVPYIYKKDKSLGLWVFTQRQKQMQGTLRGDKKEQLDGIGFRWSFNDQKDKQWNEKYRELKRFKEQNGHLRLAGGSLKNWAGLQRVQFAAGKMSHERKALLDKIDFRWDFQTRSV